MRILAGRTVSHNASKSAYMVQNYSLLHDKYQWKRLTYRSSHHHLHRDDDVNDVNYDVLYDVLYDEMYDANAYMMTMTTTMAYPELR